MFMHKLCICGWFTLKSFTENDDHVLNVHFVLVNNVIQNLTNFNYLNLY